MTEDHKQHRHILTSQKQQKDQKHYVKKKWFTGIKSEDTVPENEQLYGIHS